MDGTLLVYGAYGFTGSLIARTAVGDGHEPLLAGRRADPLEEQATELGPDHQVFTLEYPDVLTSRLSDVDAVLNCAGPFPETVDPLLEACPETGTDYLDIAGRIEILESVAQRDREAEDADVTVLPAVGFDVVPTDCLAAILDADLGTTDRLTLAIDDLGTVSPGTVKSIIGGLDRPGAVREEGAIRPVPIAWKTREFDFDSGSKPGVTVPCGTISTASYSTGVGTIETCATVPSLGIRAMRRGRVITSLLASGPVQRLLQVAADHLVSDPTPTDPMSEYPANVPDPG